MLRSGESAAFETKAFQATSWDIGPNMTRTKDEVRRGFSFVDVEQQGVGSSLVATTSDITQDPSRLQRVLADLNQLGVGAYNGRSAIVLLSKAEASFRADAYALIRSLEP